MTHRTNGDLEPRGVPAPIPEPDWSPGARVVLARVRARRRADVHLARALDGVERREVLRCLVEAAAALLCARSRGPAAARGASAEEVGGDGVPAIDVLGSDVPVWVEQPWIERALVRSSGGRGWRTRARTCLWMCLARGADDEALGLLAQLVDRNRRVWPAASDVLAAARLLHAGPVVAHLHATALELEGRLDGARRLYAAELERSGGRRRVARAFEGLARVHRRAGRPRAALAAAATDWHPVSLAAAARDARLLRKDREALAWTALVERALRSSCGRRSTRIAAALERAGDRDGN